MFTQKSENRPRFRPNELAPAPNKTRFTLNVQVDFRFVYFLLQFSLHLPRTDCMVRGPCPKPTIKTNMRTVRTQRAMFFPSPRRFTIALNFISSPSFSTLPLLFNVPKLNFIGVPINYFSTPTRILVHPLTVQRTDEQEIANC